MTYNEKPISYLPLSTWNWQESIKAVFSGKVTVVDVYPGVMIRAANLEIPLPSVIALNEYAPRPNTVSSGGNVLCSNLLRRHFGTNCDELSTNLTTVRTRHYLASL